MVDHVAPDHAYLAVCFGVAFLLSCVPGCRFTRLAPWIGKAGLKRLMILYVRLLGDRTTRFLSRYFVSIFCPTHLPAYSGCKFHFAQDGMLDLRRASSQSTGSKTIIQRRTQWG